MVVSVNVTLWFSGIVCYVVWYTVVPPYLLIQYLRFTAAQKKNWQIKEMAHRFQNARQARAGHNMIKSSSPNVPST
jgi:hypothetical protein